MLIEMCGNGKADLISQIGTVNLKTIQERAVVSPSRCVGKFYYLIRRGYVESDIGTRCSPYVVDSNTLVDVLRQNDKYFMPAAPPTY